MRLRSLIIMCCFLFGVTPLALAQMTAERARSNPDAQSFLVKLKPFADKVDVVGRIKGLVYPAGLRAEGAANESTVRVESVYDGDTITVSGGVKIRLLQIDTPEIKGSECFGREARRIMRKLLPAGTKVQLVGDRFLDDSDRYGRLLRYVYLNGRNLNLLLVERGAATPYFYQGERGRYAGALLAAVERARRQNRGMWRACRVSYSPTHAVQTSSRR